MVGARRQTREQAHAVYFGSGSLHVGGNLAQKGPTHNDNILQDNSWSLLGPMLGHPGPSKNTCFIKRFAASEKIAQALKPIAQVN